MVTRGPGVSQNWPKMAEMSGSPRLRNLLGKAFGIPDDPTRAVDLKPRSSLMKHPHARRGPEVKRQTRRKFLTTELAIAGGLAAPHIWVRRASAAGQVICSNKNMAPDSVDNRSEPSRRS